MDAMEIFTSIVMLLAGCGALLIGFKMLSDNMEKLFGNALKKIFNKTNNVPIVGVGMGAATTAVVQSSGVTTVMVVGFVNAGIMTLYQAASIIMGANIGTTITGWITVLNTVGGSNVSIPVAEIFMLLLFVGVFIELFAKNDKAKTAGFALAGLGMVFLGLEIMSGAMDQYSKMPEIQQFLQMMSDPFLLLLFGIAFTALMQSSSAVTSIVIMMAGSGLVIGGAGSSATLYLILGSNIGSCVTALISSIGASVNARRASVIHLLFNVIGSLLIMLILIMWDGYPGTGWTGFFSPNTFFEDTLQSWFPGSVPVQIAVFHTAFNVLCTCMFLPFAKLLVKLATIIVPEGKKGKGKDDEVVYMDKRFLATPSVAIGQLTKEVFRMADMSMDSLQTAFTGFVKRDLSAVDVVASNNEKVARLGAKISDYLVKVSASGISLADEKLVSALHSNVGDVARVADLADNLTKYTKKEVKEDLAFSKGINEKLAEMHELLKKQYDMVKRIVLEKEYGLLVESDKLEDTIDNTRRALVAEHIERLAQGKCRPENNTVFINLVCNLERIGDHLSYVAHSVEV